MTGILAVVRQPQPLSSWGWAAIEKVKASMGAQLRRRAREARAQRLGRRHGPRARASTKCSVTAPRRARRCSPSLIKDRQRRRPRRRRLTWPALQGDAAKAVAAAALKDTRAGRPPARRRSARCAWASRPTSRASRPSPTSTRSLNDPDRFVRWAGRIAIEHTAARGVEGSRARRDQPARRARRDARVGPHRQRREPAAGASTSSSAMLKQTNLSVDNKLRLYRTFMYTTTEVKDGLPPAERSS